MGRTIRYAVLPVMLAGLAPLAGAQPMLPDGPGQALVSGMCVACHDTSLITGSTGYTQAGWHSLISTMIDLPEPVASQVTEYLAVSFPPTMDRAPTLIDGPVRVSFQEWIAPTLGQRARDPFQLEDGTIWWVGQYGSVIGRLNPVTGEMKEYRLSPEVRPHSIIADAGGMIWYMGNANGTIGVLDPATGETTVYPMPDPAARDPHTPIFDQDGILWFTLQQSNMVGRLDPATGGIKLVTLPTPGSRPYGIKVDSKGTLWVACNGSNRVVSVNPDTMAVSEYPTPTPETRIRRLALTSDDLVWYVDSARGYLGRLDPASGEIKTWPSPSGPLSHPYAIEVIDDVIWYNESNQRPDALVRFDPKTERFQSWAIPSGVGIIRHMNASPDGNLVIHQSSSNRIGLVTLHDETT